MKDEILAYIKMTECEFCPDKVEDKVHFLFECTLLGILGILGNVFGAFTSQIPANLLLIYFLTSKPLIRIHKPLRSVSWRAESSCDVLRPPSQDFPRWSL